MKNRITDKLNDEIFQEKPKTSLLLECEITDKTEIPEQKPVILVDGRRYLMEGDFAIITGLKKAGKSHVMRRLIFTALMKEINQECDTFKIRTMYSDKKYVVYVDTEQHPSKTKEIRKYCWKRAGLKSEPETLKTYNIRHKETEEKVAFIEELMTDLGENIHLMIVDGVSDLLDSINDELQSKKLAQAFFSTKHKNISFVFAIHERAGGGGAMGWLGQHIEKKAGGGICIMKDNKTDTHSINCSFLRDDGNFKPIEFKYDDSLNDFRTLDANEALFLREKTKEEKERDKDLELRSLIKHSFGGLKVITKSSLLTLVINNDVKQRGEKTARRLIKEATDKTYIVEFEKNQFKLNLEK